MKRTIKLFIFVIVALVIFNSVFLIFYFKNKGVNLFSVENKQLTDEGKKYFIESMKNYPFTEQTLVIEKEAERTDKYVSYVVSYKSEGLKLYALLNIPLTKKPANGFPVVIVNHGYIRPDIYSTTKRYKFISSYYAINGFVVLKPDYRGHDKSENTANTILNRVSYPVDVLNLIYTIGSIKEVDKNNIFMMGHSLGGGVTLAVIEATDKVKAASLWAGVSNEFPESALYFRRKRSELEANKFLLDIKLYYDEKDFPKLSVTNYFNYIKSSIIIHHGTSDESVPYSWSEVFVKKLNEAGVYNEFYTYNADDHNFNKNINTVLSRDIVFFKKFIK